MATITLHPNTATDVLAAINARLNLGSGAGTIKLYTGTKPTYATGAITSQVLLGTLTLSDPAGVVATVGEITTLTFSAITSDTDADATGTCTWARLADSSGNTVCDIDVTNTGGGGFGQMNTTSITIHGPITAPSVTITA